MALASSFELVNPQPEDIARQLRTTASEVEKVSGGLLCLCGGPALQALEVARAVSNVLDVPLAIACGSGVLTERGEHDGVSHAAGLLWRGGTCRPLWFDVGPDPEGSEVLSRLRAEIARKLEGAAGSIALFAQPEAFPPTTLTEAAFGRDLRVQLFGGGVTGRPGALLVHQGEVHVADVVGLGIVGLARPLVRASVGCRLLGNLQPITQAEGRLVLRIGERSALEVLQEQAGQGTGRELLMAALGVGRDEAGQHSRLLLRALRGIHESRGGILLGESVQVGTRLAFALRDSAAAREDLETSLREMAREMAGGTPRFGIYVDSSNRGAEMYGVSNIDVGMIHTRWPTMPLVGLKSPFEIGPGRGAPTVHLYSGVLSVFCAPS